MSRIPSYRFESSLRIHPFHDNSASWADRSRWSAAAGGWGSWATGREGCGELSIRAAIDGVGLVLVHDRLAGLSALIETLGLR